MMEQEHPDTGAQTPRKARRVRRAVMTPEAVLLRLGKAMDVADELLNHPDPALRLRAVHAITQTAGTWGRVLETAQLADRVAALEQAVKEAEAVA